MEEKLNDLKGSVSGLAEPTCTIEQKCPICGGNGEVINRHTYDWIVECPECGFGTGGYATINMAVAAWNRRVSLDRLDSSVSCPLCGGHSHLVNRDETGFYRECDSCLCSTAIYDDVETAERMWRCRYVAEYLDRMHTNEKIE